jgi:hypothetical protein
MDLQLDALSSFDTKVPSFRLSAFSYFSTLDKNDVQVTKPANEMYGNNKNKYFSAQLLNF